MVIRRTDNTMATARYQMVIRRTDNTMATERYQMVLLPSCIFLWPLYCLSF
jgi:hypothetical protein